MLEELKHNAETYARVRTARIIDELGFGVHGNVYLFLDLISKGRYAVKAHRHREAYARERDVYHRLRENHIETVRSFHVPRFIRSHDELRIIEMTIVTKPHVLDFGAGYLDHRPEFSEEVWADWEEKTRDRFGARWAVVEEILAEFEQLGVFLLDPTPDNIAFLD